MVEIFALVAALGAFHGFLAVAPWAALAVHVPHRGSALKSPQLDVAAGTPSAQFASDLIPTSRDAGVCADANVAPTCDISSGIVECNRIYP